MYTKAVLAPANYQQDIRFQAVPLGLSFCKVATRSVILIFPPTFFNLLEFDTFFVSKDVRTQRPVAFHPLSSASFREDCGAGGAGSVVAKF